MLLGSVQMCGQQVGHAESKDIHKSLTSNQLRVLSLRECTLSDKHFRQLMEGVGKSSSLLHLNLNVSVINSLRRIAYLTNALQSNRSLTTLLLHSSNLADDGMAMLASALSNHPHVVTLDVGDSHISDDGLMHVTKLLARNGAKPGLQNLTLSANRSVTSFAWNLFFAAINHNDRLESLQIDYNELGDYAAAGLSVAIASCQQLHSLDIEGCSIGEQGARSLLFSLRSYNRTLRRLSIAENDISPQTINELSCCIQENNRSAQSAPSPCLSDMTTSDLTNVSEEENTCLEDIS